LFIPWRSLKPNAARRFCLIAAATVFIFFSLASAKLIPYILPIFPFAAVAAADGLMAFGKSDEPVIVARLGLKQNLARNLDSRRLAWMTMLFVPSGFAVLAIAVGAARFKSPYPAILQPVLYVSGAIVLICAIVCTWTLWRRRLEAGLALLIGGAAVTLLMISYGRIRAEPTRSYAALARTIERLAPRARLICYPRYIESLPFYCRRRVILVGAKTELAFGAEHAPDGSAFFFTRVDDLLRLWREPLASVLIIDRGVLGQLQGLLGNYQVIASDSRKLALVPGVNFPDSGKAELRK
jgi:4-amino-4-deoxy-L-arabinose transferase-like glycosyltransferase